MIAAWKQIGCVTQTMPTRGRFSDQGQQLNMTYLYRKFIDCGFSHSRARITALRIEMVTWPCLFQGWFVIHKLGGLATINLCTKSEVTPPATMKVMQNAQNTVVWNSHRLPKVTGNSTVQQSASEFLLAFHCNCVPILGCFWDTMRYSLILSVFCATVGATLLEFHQDLWHQKVSHVLLYGVICMIFS